jgi:GH35 family endo-1,4-beta-xylanase
MENYNSVKPTKEERMKQMILNDLLEAGVTIGQSGKSVHDMDYDELKYELTLQAFREIDIKSDSARWF